jgi:hypothetical protein
VKVRIKKLKSDEGKVGVEVKVRIEKLKSDEVKVRIKQSM